MFRFRYLFVIGLLLFFVAACAPATPDEAVSQSDDAADTSNVAQDMEEDHRDEDADAHDHEEGKAHEDDDDHAHDEEGDHSDEDADDHAHEKEDGDDHAHEDDDDHAHDEDADGHDHEDGERREHGAHEHGAAELMIAWSGNDMAIDLETPSYNVLGFEYMPQSDEEKNLLAESVALLEAGDLLQINPDAECVVVSAAVQSMLMEEGHDDEADDAHEHDADEAETHSNIDASYNLECQQPDDIESLDGSQLFAQFPNFEAIQVQWVSDTQQSAGNLTSDNPVLSFK